MPVRLNESQIDSSGNKGEIIAASAVVCYEILGEIFGVNEAPEPFSVLSTSCCSINLESLFDCVEFCGISRTSIEHQRLLRAIKTRRGSDRMKESENFLIHSTNKFFSSNLFLRNRRESHKVRRRMDFCGFLFLVLDFS